MSDRATELVGNLRAVESRIASACRMCGRDPESVRLIAVSKTHPSADILALYKAGHRDFGENYVQEWQHKSEELPDDIIWHFIGRLQSNKVRFLADRVSWIHGIDNIRQLRQIDRRFSRPIDVLIQVNTGNDFAKGGVEPELVPEFLGQFHDFERPRVRGVMTIPPFDEPIDVTRGHFHQLSELARSAALIELSMGMTSDFEAAIAEGATMVRVGTAIFGARS